MQVLSLLLPSSRKYGVVCLLLISHLKQGQERFRATLQILGSGTGTGCPRNVNVQELVDGSAIINHLAAICKGEMVTARSITSIALLASSALAIWPLPTKYSHGDQVLWIAREKVTVSYSGFENVRPLLLYQPEQLLTVLEQNAPGYGHSSGNATYGTHIVTNAVERTFKTLFEQNFIPWKFRPRLSDFEPEECANATYISSIVLTQTAADSNDIMKPSTGLDESYTLDVSSNGTVNVSARTSIGLLYGLTTFSQLFYKHSGGGVYTPLAPVTISDAPKFKWRGLNVDTSRSFKPMADLYRMIDALSYNKMNRLHWHVTDSQSWPLEIDSMPEVADKGVYVKYQRYTKEDVKALQQYGALLGVEVALEIDQPGHTASIAFSHPELIAAFNVQPKWTDYCAQPPCGTLKLNSTKVYDFLEKLLDDLLPRLKPLTRYFHLGGDEVNMNSYTLDDTVGSNDSAVLQPLMQKFMDRNMKQVASYDLVPLVWEEMLLTWNLTLPKNTIVQTWQSDEAVADVVSKGYQALVGNYHYCTYLAGRYRFAQLTGMPGYLDCGKGQFLDFYPSNAAEFWPFQDYCAPLHNWRVMYSYDPLQGVPKNLTHLVLGGEAHIWSEQTDTHNLDPMVIIHEHQAQRNLI